MRLFFSITLFVILTNCFGQNRQRLISTDLERLGLKGNIKSLTHLDYDPIKNISDTTSLRIDHFFLAPNNHTLVFNLDGFLTMNTEFEYLHREDSLKPKGVWNYSYDSLNRINQETYYWNNNSKDTTIWVYEYFGDSVTLIHKYDDTYKHMRYRYEQRRNIEYLTTANSDSSYLTRVLFAYDNQNRLIRKEEYEDQNTITFIRSWAYADSLSNSPSTDVGISAKHNYGPIIIFNEYDSLQNIKLSKGVNSDKPTITEYTYDRYGNWTERRTQLPNERIKISRRTIEYFEK
jgi:hypothetical protein